MPAVRNETVYRILDWEIPGSEELEWSDLGPFEGIADFGGTPHHFIREFDPSNDRYNRSFILTPLDRQTLVRFEERWPVAISALRSSTPIRAVGEFARADGAPWHGMNNVLARMEGEPTVVVTWTATSSNRSAASETGGDSS